MLARREQDFGDLNDDRDWAEVKTDSSQRPWTDDFSNIASVLTIGRAFGAPIQHWWRQVAGVFGSKG